MIFKVFLESELAKVPSRADEGAAGYDLSSVEELEIEPGTRKLVNTGVRMQLPMCTYGRVAPRSGLSVKGIDIGAGVIDESYRGLVKVLLINNSKATFKVHVGDRIAQLVIEPICRLKPTIISDVKEFDASERGDGGFGSTGVN